METPNKQKQLAPKEAEFLERMYHLTFEAGNIALENGREEELERVLKNFITPPPATAVALTTNPPQLPVETKDGTPTEVVAVAPVVSGEKPSGANSPVTSIAPTSAKDVETVTKNEEASSTRPNFGPNELPPSRAGKFSWLIETVKQR